MRTNLLRRLKPVIATALVLGLVAAPLAVAAQSGAFRPRSGYEESTREYRDATPPLDRRIEFRGECAYEEHVRATPEGWTLVEHVMRCIEKIPPRTCVVVDDARVAAHPADCGRRKPVPCAEPVRDAPPAEPARSEPVEPVPTEPAREEPRTAESPRPCPEPVARVRFALVGADGRARAIESGGSIPVEAGLKLVARSGTPAALHFAALQHGAPMGEWDAKIGPESPFAFSVDRLAGLGSTELVVAAELANGEATRYHFRLVYAPEPAPPQPAEPQPAEPVPVTAEPAEPNETA